MFFSSPSLNSDGEEMSTADNFNDIYYSLKYEGDLLFTRLVTYLSDLYLFPNQARWGDCGVNDKVIQVIRWSSGKVWENHMHILKTGMCEGVLEKKIFYEKESPNIIKIKS